MPRFRDRRDAGLQLAAKLAGPLGRAQDVVVLALPRGGVPVAYEVAARLDAPLDVLVTRRLAVPGDEAVAMGMIASGGAQVLDRDTLANRQIRGDAVQRAIAREQLELARRERRYRGDAPAEAICGKQVVVVDEGLATGATMIAACRALRALLPARVTVAVPIAAAETCTRLRGVADEVICVDTPRPFPAVGVWYADFTPTSDEEVQALLARARAAHAAEPAAQPATAA